MTQRRIELDDLLLHRIPFDVRTDSEGRCAVWVERWVDAETKKTCSTLALWRAEGGARPLTSGPRRDAAPRLSPDGRRLAFLRGAAPGPEEEEGFTELCVLPLDGGEAQRLVRFKGTLHPPVWSPDGRWLVLAARRADPAPEGEKKPLFVRVTRLLYKDDAEGYLPSDRFSLYRVDTRAAAPALEPLTDPAGDWDDTDPVFSPDGERLAFLSNRRADRERDVEAQDIWVMPAGGGEPEPLTRERGMRRAPAWSPDGRHVAYVGYVGPRGYALARANVEMYRVAADGSGDEQSLTANLDRCIMNLTIDDLFGLQHWIWAPAFAADGAQVVFPVADEGRCWVASLALDERCLPAGPIRPVVDDGTVVCASLASGTGQLVMIRTSARDPGRIEQCDLRSGERRLLAWPMGEYCQGVAIAEPRELRVTSPDGNEVQGWLLLPPGPGPFPLLLDIHGGPMVQFGPVFFHELQAYVAAGYALLFVNPRGSQGYGAKFAGAIYRNWGEPAFNDLMAALDWAVANNPIDAARLGVLGGSYGGYMTNWVIAHTNRFKAACTQRTVSSMEAMIWSDYGFAFADELGAQPWEDPELFTRLSPMTYAARMNTPLLIEQGLGDLRTPADQGERLYTMLRSMGKEVEMVLFPGANHDMSRNGQPRQRVERLKVLHEWFARHLGA